MTVKRPAEYHKTFLDEDVASLLIDYIDDGWDEITAAETPQAITEPGKKKRSGEYQQADFRKALEEIKK